MDKSLLDLLRLRLKRLAVAALKRSGRRKWSVWNANANQSLIADLTEAVEDNRRDLHEYEAERDIKYAKIVRAALERTEKELAEAEAVLALYMGRG